MSPMRKIDVTLDFDTREDVDSDYESEKDMNMQATSTKVGSVGK